MEKQNWQAFNFSAAEIENLISSVEKAKPILFVRFHLRSLTKIKRGSGQELLIICPWCPGLTVQLSL